MDMTVTQFFGQTITVGAVTTIVTQILKSLEGLPAGLQKIPYIGPSLAWLIDTITPEDPAAIRIFVAGMCFALNALGFYIANGYVQMDLMLALTTLKSFIDATAAYQIVVKPVFPNVA